MNAALFSLAQLLIVAFVAPFALGLVRFFKARMQGRHGASPFLPYWSFLTLLRKQMVISRSTSWVFRLVPFVVLGSTLFIAVCLPLFTTDGIVPSLSNLFVIAGVLMLGSVFLVFGGLESASAFGGMGSSREMTIASLVEPALIFSLSAFALVAHSSRVSDMLQVGGLGLLQYPPLFFSLLALLLVSLAENARYPVDNPATHLELTMVHEAMVLEYSGPYLAMLEYASSLKLTVFAVLCANIVWPFPLLQHDVSVMGFVLGVVVLLFKIILTMFLLALLESSIPKMRFYRMQEYLSAAFFVAAAGFVFLLLAFL
jgi:formate hydrogenlyase subunit 4